MRPAVQLRVGRQSSAASQLRKSATRRAAAHSRAQRRPPPITSTVPAIRSDKRHRLSNRASVASPVTIAVTPRTAAASATWRARALGGGLKSGGGPERASTTDVVGGGEDDLDM
jgi:hypothetical protein